MRKSTKTVGIIGFGAFGKLTASLIPKDIKLKIHDQNLPECTALIDIASCDIIILAIPLAAYPDVLPIIAKHIQPESLIIDVCSVKVKPAQLFKKYLPVHKNVLLCHPLFGPQTYLTQQNKKLIVTETLGESANKVLAFCSKNLGLDIVHMSADEHDEHMARVHVLTFFIGRACNNLKLGEEKIITPSFKSIAELVALDNAQSEELFKTVNLGNPYSEKIRQMFIKELEEVDKSLQL